MNSLLEHPLTTLIPILAWFEKRPKPDKYVAKVEGFTMPTGTVLRGGTVVKGYEFRSDNRLPLWRRILRSPKSLAIWITARW